MRIRRAAALAVLLAASAPVMAARPPGTSAPMRPSLRAPVASAPAPAPRRGGGRFGMLEATSVQSTSQDRHIDVNNLNMVVTNFGSFANDIEHLGNSGLFFPKGTTKTAVYASGIWLVGKENGELRASIGEYSQEYIPGTMTGSAPSDPGNTNPDFIVYKVARWAGNPNDTAHVERSAADIARDATVDPLVHHSWSEYMRGAAPYGAPVRDYRFPDPASPGDSVTITGPDVSGDQMLWSVYNDAHAPAHTNRAGRTAPLGVEIRQSTFGFDRQGALGNTVFLRFEVTNHSGNRIDSCYVNLWSDPDLGGSGDDLVGSDTTLSLGYVYNATNNDQVYGDRPPAVGYDFFQGPRSSTGEVLPLTAFVFYQNGTDPQNVAQTFCYMQGRDANCDPFEDEDGNPTPFYAWGDPVTGTGFLDANPSDRRFMLISGPFTLEPESTQTIVGAIVVAQGGDRLSSITGLKFFDVKAQTAFDVAFDLPSPPPQPEVTASTTPTTVTLFWDSNSRFNYQPTYGYAFEGFNVYQGASVSGPWKRIRTFDVANGIKDVRDTVFDVNTGLIISDQPTAFGGDNGIQYTFTADQDYIRGGPLRPGTTYYYAVTAYSVNLNPPRRGFEKVLETSFQPEIVTVQGTATGTDVGAARVFEADLRRAPGATGPTPTTHVLVDVVNPGAITGHTYCVQFQTLASPQVVDGDTVRTSWSLVDSTTGAVVIPPQLARTDSPDYASVDGMLVRLRESAGVPGPLNDVYYVPFRRDMPIGSVDAGLQFFGGGWDYAWNFLAGIDPEVSPDSFPTVELRFGVTQKAYRYYRLETASGGAPTPGRGYLYGGFGDIGVQAWDVTNNRQLEIGFVERQVTNAAGTPTGSQPATHDGTWSPDASDLGGREYLQISLRPYTGTPDPALAQDAAIAGADTLWLYGSWLRRTGVGATAAGDKFVMLTGGVVPATAADTLCFDTRRATTGDVGLQRARMADVRVVPNPYYSRSTYELSGFNRIVKFTNMPETATVRIYTLAGTLVRTLRKTDTTSSLLEWDLQNENRLPVASGIYVYAVDAPGAGNVTGRLVVFMERERLLNY